MKDGDYYFRFLLYIITKKTIFEYMTMVSFKNFSKMNDRTTQLLQQLAEKLGTTTQYIWTVLVNHARISAVFSIIECFICLSVIIFTGFMYKKYKSVGTANEIFITAAILLTIISIVALFGIVLSVRNIINALLDPKYWALEHIIDLIRN